MILLRSIIRVYHHHVPGNTPFVPRAEPAKLDLRLAEALGTTPGYWLALQVQRDLWTARQTARERKRIKRMTVPELETA